MPSTTPQVTPSAAGTFTFLARVNARDPPKSHTKASAFRGSSRVATKRSPTTTSTSGKPTVRPFALNVPLLAKKGLWFSVSKSQRNSDTEHAATRGCQAAGELSFDASKIDARSALSFSVARADTDRRLRRLQREAIDRDVREAYAVGRKRSALLDAARGFVQARVDYAAECESFARHLEHLSAAGRATKPTSRPTLPDEIWDMLSDRLEGLSHWSGISFDSLPFGEPDSDGVFQELLDAAVMEDQSANSGRVKALRAAVNKFNAPSARSRHRRKQIPFRAPAPPVTRPSPFTQGEPQTMDDAIALLTNAIRLFQLTDGSQASDLEMALYDIIYGRDSFLDLADSDAAIQDQMDAGQ
ncbi:hypothetical protein AURDEDRAFT_159709 [Auricularia subglabra TFB-10046 SS5]|nr:hypothetical protein AURDEDRAFT_159709 [Auricularia subglabra TFB-10046 SS5]